MPPVLPLLTERESLYVIIGSSAAALTGLQFVVIALGAAAKVLGGDAELRAFATPTIVHFCVVLLLGAILSTPGQTPASLSLCLGASGLGGLGYACCGIHNAWDAAVYMAIKRKEDPGAPRPAGSSPAPARARAAGSSS